MRRQIRRSVIALAVAIVGFVITTLGYHSLTYGIMTGVAVLVLAFCVAVSDD